MSEKKVTWSELVKREPRLAALLAEAQAVKDTGGPHFCANSVWYRRFKPRLMYLVGWYAERDDPVLRTSLAYDIAYRKVYDVLPPCRNCACL